MRFASTLCGCIGCCLASVALAASPFDGTWHLNAAKSQLTGDMLSFKDDGSGGFKYTDSTESYSFKPDGSSFTTPAGTEMTFRPSSEGSYTSTAKRHGLLLRTTTWQPAADGKTLTVESKGTKPNGDAFDNTETYARSSPGKGIAGDWKGTQVSLSSPNSLSFKTEGDELTLMISAMKATWHGKLDGKDTPASGPTVPDGLTVAITSTGPHSMKLVEKLNGKPVDISEFRVAADGKSMTNKGTDGQGKEPYTEFYEKGN